jgi:hypothetical protein
MSLHGSGTFLTRKRRIRIISLLSRIWEGSRIAGCLACLMGMGRMAILCLSLSKLTCQGYLKLESKKKLKNRRKRARKAEAKAENELKLDFLLLELVNNKNT